VITGNLHLDWAGQVMSTLWNATAFHGFHKLASAKSKLDTERHIGQVCLEDTHI